MLRFFRPVKLELHCALMRGDLPRTAELLSLGVEVNATTLSGITPLHCAFSSDHKIKHVLSRMLLDIPGIKVNIQDGFQITPLHLAIRKSAPIGVIQKLLQVGYAAKAKMNLLDKEGHSPLHDAILNKRFDVVFLLLQYSEFRDDPKAGQILAASAHQIARQLIANARLYLLKILLSYPAVITHPNFDLQELVSFAEQTSELFSPDKTRANITKLLKQQPINIIQAFSKLELN